MSSQELKTYQSEQARKQLELNRLAAQKVLASLISSMKLATPTVTQGKTVQC